MVETNPFLYFIPENANKLIIGSFPCYNGKDYGDWFYSGSGRNHFWQLLSDTLQMPGSTKKEKIALCAEHGIALTDVGHKIERTAGNCSDANLKLVEFNKKGIDTCLKAGIRSIFFTGKFAEKHFRKNYPAINIPSFVLLSPSPAANMHIGGLEEYKKMIRKKIIRSPYEYRLFKYKECFLK